MPPPNEQELLQKQPNIVVAPVVEEEVVKIFPLNEIHQAHELGAIHLEEQEEQLEEIALEHQEEQTIQVFPIEGLAQRQRLAQREAENLARNVPINLEPIQEQAIRERERLAALKQDEKLKKSDERRHKFYGFVKKIVDFFSYTKRKKAQTAARETTEYHQSLQMAYDELIALRMKAADDGPAAEQEFVEKYGDYFHRVEQEVNQLRAQVRERMQEEQQGEPVNEVEFQRRLTLEMTTQLSFSRFHGREAANVDGGTKPVSTQFHQDGSRWLVKEAVSCIGVNEPFSAMVTEAGYKIQKLVNPDTAIEAHRGISAGQGVVSFQRMVQGVKAKGEDVDLFQFSRTPESLTDQELARVQELSPQILREHTTDWLLCNFDTKGENFLITNDGTGPDRVYGIDKEAAFRRIRSPGAQKMSKDYKGFDQETVYNRLFQLFAGGKMDLNLQNVLPQLQRVEAMSDEDYMATFDTYLREKRIRDPKHVDEIRRNILRRKVGLRLEYRAFFTQLVEERCKNVTPGQARDLRIRYFGSENGTTFRFDGEDDGYIEADQVRQEHVREVDREVLEQKTAKADKADQKSYNRRHALYDFSKGFISFFKSIGRKLNPVQEAKTVQVKLSQVKEMGHLNPLFQHRYRTIMTDLQLQLRREMHDDILKTEEWYEAELARRMELQEMPLTMEIEERVSLGGTKPMSQHLASDGSRWLTKQAVNCMGYSKPEGALLTEAGAKLQAIVHQPTAVEAFVGATSNLGMVSFQRRLDDVEGGPQKLDLFKFSKHPELATRETIRAVQELGPQILREHTTDWLLCNFDTKGENFIITRKQGEPRVLHGIDKEAAFNKILKPEAQSMSTTYKPHANNTLYNVVYSMYASNQMDLNLFDTFPQIEKVNNMSDDDYMQLYAPFLEELAKKKEPEEVAETAQKILERKQRLEQEYCDFFTTLVNQRCEKLSPHQAALLKDRYFDAGGRFSFEKRNQVPNNEENH